MIGPGLVGVVVRAVIVVGMLVMMPVRGWPGGRMTVVAAVEMQVAGVGRAVERERQRGQQHQAGNETAHGGPNQAQGSLSESRTSYAL